MRIIGYVCDHILPTVTQEDTQILDAINIAFGTIGTDSLLNTAKLKHIEWIKKIKTWNPQLKIILSVGGWGAGGFSIMARTEEGRRNFVRSCKDYVDANGLDGIDIDWEYPCSSLAEIDADPTDKQNFTLLLAELRKALGTGFLSMCVTPKDIDAMVKDGAAILSYGLNLALFGENYGTLEGLMR